jgi:hypothetical protein
MEGGHRVAHVLKAHERLSVDRALHAVNDLIGSDHREGRSFFQKIDGPKAGGGVKAHVGDPCTVARVRSRLRAISLHHAHILTKQDVFYRIGPLLVLARRDRRRGVIKIGAKAKRLSFQLLVDVPSL